MCDTYRVQYSLPCCKLWGSGTSYVAVTLLQYQVSYYESTFHSKCVGTGSSYEIYQFSINVIICSIMHYVSLASHLCQIVPAFCLRIHHFE